MTTTIIIFTRPFKVTTLWTLFFNHYFTASHCNPGAGVGLRSIFVEASFDQADSLPSVPKAFALK